MVWDTINDTMDESELLNIVDMKVDGDDDNYFVAIGTLHGVFHCLQVLDCHGQGQHWNLWASAHMDDTLITTILDMVTEWRSEYNDKDELPKRLLTTHKTTVEV